jgi:hypothetical protein
VSLDVRLLEKVRELDGGVVQARCPACAEGGRDQGGEHLRVYPDGRFGCCVYPKDREHRKRIFALAGDTSPRSFSVKLARVKVAAPAHSVTAALTSFVRTLRTPVLESRACASGNGDVALHPSKDTDEPVLSVLASLETASSERLPYITDGGTLVIPFNSPAKFHWWKGGQPVAQTSVWAHNHQLKK